MPHQPHSTLYKWMMAAGLALVFVVMPEMKGFAQAPVQQETNTANKKVKHKSKNNSFLSGTVLDHNREPLIHAIVELLNHGKTIASAVTDMDGNYSFNRMQNGTYSIRVRY